VQGLPLHDFLELQDAEGIDHLPDPTARALASGQPTPLETGTLVQQADADAVPVELRASPIRDDRQRLLGAVLVMRNITERRRAEAALARMAQLDALTGLPNRAALLPQIAAMASNARRVGKSLAVLFVDLDGFKDVNDSYGHRIGDELLVQVARRLRSGLRAEDYVARLGGDEFVVLAGNLPEPAMARAIGRKLIGILGRPYRIDEHAISITASIGISLPAAEAIEATELLRQADLAMYWAKGRGKNRFATFAEGHSAAGSPAGGPAPSIRDAD
jgi:diguanylate cyclase (GGDEF)-like protein